MCFKDPRTDIITERGEIKIESQYVTHAATVKGRANRGRCYAVGSLDWDASVSASNAGGLLAQHAP